MKIAYLTADVGVPVHGTKGASIHVSSVASELAGLGHEVLILTPSPGAIPKENQKFRVTVIPLGGAWPDIADTLKEEEICQGNRLRKDIRNLMYNSWLQYQAQQLLDSFRPDFIYERYSLFGTAGAYLAQHYGIPLILEVNAPLVEEQAQQRGLTLPKVATKTQQLVFRAADHVIVVSSWLRNYALRNGAAPERITVMPNGVDTEKFVPLPNSQIRETMGWKDSFVVGYVGTMKDWHGLPTVLEGIKIAKEDILSLKLLLVGDGPQLPLLRSQIKQWELEDTVHITGLVAHEEVPKWVEAMDAALVPFSANAAEYFSPVKLFEYMAMEKPVLAARTSQTAEILTPGETGWLYNPGDSKELAAQVSWMHRNREDIKIAGKNARKYVHQHHTWKQNAKKVMQIAEACNPVRHPCPAP